MHDFIQSLIRKLKAGPSDTDIKNVVPIIVPRSYFSSGNWPGPGVNLRHAELAMTWVILEVENSMTYVNDERAKSWDESSIDWKAIAMTNLEERSKPSPWTHAKIDDNEECVFVAMMQDDGLGSSRLLLKDALEKNLRPTYRIGLPDRSCAVVFPNQITSVDGKSPAAMIRDMYDGASTPMMGELLAPEDFEICEDCT